MAWSVAWLVGLGLLPPLASKVTVGKDYISHDFDPVIGWPMVAVITVMIVGPWVPIRFSLRALLVAMTLVAVGLGVVLWASR